MALALAASLVTVASSRPAAAAPPIAAQAAPATAAKPCPPDRPDIASAAIAARLCRDRVGVSGLTTETTVVWANADGTMSAEQHLAPVRVRVGDEWVPVDLTLARRPDGTVAPKAHARGVTLAGAARDAGEHELVGLGVGEERVALAWAGPLPEPVLDGSVATYPDVRPGVDLVIKVHRTGYEQSFVVKNATGLAQVARLTLPMRTGTGLTAAADRAGGLVLRNRAGREIGRTHAAEMWDAAVAPNSLEHVRRAPVAMTLRSLGKGRAAIDLTPDAAFLARKDLQFPVTIDPPASLNPSFDAFVQSGWVDDQSGAPELKLGYVDDGGVWTARSYLQFDTSGMWDQQVLDATLHMWEWHSWSCAKAQWEAKRSGPVSSAIRWTNQPTHFEQIGVSDQTTGHDAACNDGWVSIQLKNGFQSAATSHWATLPIVLKAVNESNHNGWKRFDSMEGAHDPYITFTYNAAPSVPANPTVAPCYTGCGSGAAVGAVRPTLSVLVADPNAGDTIRAEFEVWNAGHTSLIAGSGLMTGVATGTTVPWQVPLDLTTATTYEWRARAYDGRNYSAWSGWNTMTIDTAKPGVPFVGATLYANDGQPHGGAGVADQFTFTPASGTTDLGAFVYQLDTSSTQTTIAATAATSVSITPPSDGHRTLTVFAKDRAGNLSNPNVYQFQVGSAALAQPLPGAVVVKRAKLAVDTVVPQYTRAYFEYRRGPGGTVLTVPSAHLSTATGAPVTATAASPVALSSLGGYANWSALATLGSIGGVVEVRAQLYTATSPTPVYATAWVRVTVDPNGDGSASTNLDTGSANLLTGDFTVSTNDSDDLGLNVGRVTSSRAPADGFQAMAERLTPNQQQVSTDLTGFTLGATVSAARVTTLGQGEPVTAGVFDSIEITPVTTSSNDTYVTVGGDFGGLRLSMQGGKTYRMTGWIYVPSASGLVPGYTSRGLRIVAFYRDSAGVYREFASAKAGYLDAWQELTVDLPVPVGATEAFFRLYNGMQGGSGRKVYWDHLSMTEIVSPFGPSWTGGATGGDVAAEYTTLTFPESSVARVNTIGGGWITFSRNADGVTFTPEPGGEGMVLSKIGSTSYRLTDLDGSVTEFTSVGGVWAATSSWTVDANSTTRYVYDTSQSRTLLKKVINPVDPGVDDVNHCSVPVKGCEVLEYVYSTATTPGLSQTVFGDYVDTVKQVLLWAWDPISQTMGSQSVSEYRYDNIGQLREVWDPRVSPALKTAYEYGQSGRLVKVTPPGELPWSFEYGSPDVDPAALLRWNLDEGSGTTTGDASGHAKTGTLAGAAGWGQGNDATYPTDRAATFTGAAGQQVAAPGAILNTTQSFTVSAWVNLSDTAVNRTAVSQDGTRTSGFFLGYHQAINRWIFSRVTADSDSSSAVRASSNSPPVLGAWTHLTGVYDTASGVMRLYVNGVPQATTIPTGNWNATGAFVVGRAKWAGAGTNYWTGGVDDVRAYQKALTGDQVAALAGDENPGRLLRIRRAALQQGSKTVTNGETVTNLVYQVPLTRAKGGPYDMDYAAISTWGQQDLPVDATAVFGAEQEPTVNSATAVTPGQSGYPYAEVHYLNANGQEVNTASPGGHVDTNEYDKFGNTVRTLQATDRELALGTLPGASAQLAQLGLTSLDTAARAQALSTLSTYATDGVDLIDQLGPIETVALASPLVDPNGVLPTLAAGTTVVGRSHTRNTYDQGKPDGATYHLNTTSVEGVLVAGYPDADAHTTKTGYGAEKGGTSGWQLRLATSTIVDASPGGANLTTYVVYNSAGQTTESWTIGADGADARTSRSIFYSAGANAADPACGNRPEWAGRVCVSQAAGPITGERPDMTGELPVKRVVAFSRYGDAAQVVETSDGHTRTTTRTVDGGGRVTTAEITSDVGTALPPVVTQYDPANGEVISTTMGGTAVLREYDLLGRQVKYTDADGGVTTHEFDRLGRPVRVVDPTGTTVMGYDLAAEPRGFLTSVSDSVAGTFTGGYSPDGQLVQVGYPGGITRRDTLEPSLEPAQRVYTRDSDGEVIYADAVVRNGEGHWVLHTYTGGSKTYGYDRLGRLNSVRQVDAAGACTTRAYDYDDRTNRTAKWVYAPAPDGSCRSDTPDVTESHTYDTSDRITDAGFVYDAFGRTTTLPGGLTNSYYVNDLVASQELADQRRSWTVYPDQRLRANASQTLVEGSWVAGPTMVNHYGDDTDRPRWITESGTGAVSRNVTGPDGDLIATTSAAGDVSLKLVNLHGDVAVSIDPSLTTPEVYSFDEYGLPSAGQNQQRYGWFGGKMRSGDALGGVILMGVRLYSPALGRFLQVDPQPGGSATAYDYCNADAVNCTDLDGRWPNWKNVWNGVKKAASVVYEHASDIGTVVGTVSLFLPPPANLIGGAIALGFSALGAYRDARAGNWGQFALGVIGAVPGVGALAKGIKAYKAGKTFAKALSKLKSYKPKPFSKKPKLKDIVRPFRKARAAYNKAKKELRPWERVANGFGVFDGARMTCKYWSACNRRVPYSKYWI